MVSPTGPSHQQNQKPHKDSQPTKPGRSQTTWYAGDILGSSTSPTCTETPTNETPSATDRSIADRNVTLPLKNDTSKIVSSIKKHSSLWVLFQKVKRFVHTVSINKDSKNITSKDTKPIPAEILDCISETLSTGDHNAPLERIKKYNIACENLGKIEKTIDDTENTETLGALKNERENIQQILLVLSKEIFSYADANIKKSQNDLENSEINVSKKDYANFFEVLKSSISFDAKKVITKGDDDAIEKLLTAAKITTGSTTSTESDEIKQAIETVRHCQTLINTPEAKKGILTDSQIFNIEDTFTKHKNINTLCNNLKNAKSHVETFKATKKRLTEKENSLLILDDRQVIKNKNKEISKEKENMKELCKDIRNDAKTQIHELTPIIRDFVQQHAINLLTHNLT